MAHGFVYVLSNESMPGIYKIGFTLRHPRERMAELSAATACPTPFELAAFIGVSDPQWVEGQIHDELSRYRVNSSREFFRASPEMIQDSLRQYADPSVDAYVDGVLELHIDEAQRVAE